MGDLHRYEKRRPGLGWGVGIEERNGVEKPNVYFFFYFACHLSPRVTWGMDFSSFFFFVGNWICISYRRGGRRQGLFFDISFFLRLRQPTGGEDEVKKRTIRVVRSGE
jgi:hypothetical protein